MLWLAGCHATDGCVADDSLKDRCCAFYGERIDGRREARDQETGRRVRRGLVIVGKKWRQRQEGDGGARRHKESRYWETRA